MPTLKQLTCHVEWPISKTPFREYGISYGDGVVESYIAIPPGSTPFAISLKSKGFIFSGLAMFVYIDGVYQCNRNRSNLKFVAPPGDVMQAPATVEFRVRQKEERLPNGDWIGRPWRFEPLNIVHSSPEDNPALQSHFDHLGTIHVLVLRCFSPSHGYEDHHSDIISDGSRSPESATSPVAGDEWKGTVRQIFAGALPQQMGDEKEQTPQINVLCDGSSDRANRYLMSNEQLAPYARVSPADVSSPGRYELKHRGKHRNRTSQGYSWKQSKGSTDRRTPTRNQKMDEGPAQDCQSDPWQNKLSSSPSVNIMEGASRDTWESRNFQVPLDIGRKSTADSSRLQSQGRYSSATPSIVVNINTVPSFQAQPTSDANDKRYRDRFTENSSLDDGCYIICNGQRIQNGGGWHRQESPDREDGQRSDWNIVDTQVVGNRNMGRKWTGNKNHKSKQTLDGWSIDNHQGNSQVEASDGRSYDNFMGFSDPQTGNGWEPDNSQDKTQSEANAEWTTGNIQEDSVKDTDWKDDHSQSDSPWKPDDTWSTSGPQSANLFSNDNDWEQNDAQDSQAKMDDWFNDALQLTDDTNRVNEGNKDTNKKQDSDKKTNTWTAQSPKDISGDTFATNDTWNSNQSVKANDEIPRSSNSCEHQENKETCDTFGSEKFSGQIPNNQSEWQAEPPETSVNSETAQKDQQTKYRQFQSNHIQPDQVQVSISPMTERTASDEPFLYTVPSYIAESRSLSHQVQLGSSAEYIHRTRRPTYMDSLDEPYAKFVFKYRLKEAIETKFGITIKRDVDEERRRLESIPKGEIITRLLRAEGILDEVNTYSSSYQDQNNMGSVGGRQSANKETGEVLDFLKTENLHAETARSIWGETTQKAAAIHGPSLETTVSPHRSSPQILTKGIPISHEPLHLNTAAHWDRPSKTFNSGQSAERENQFTAIRPASVDEWTSDTGQTNHRTETGNRSDNNGRLYEFGGSTDPIHSAHQYSDWGCSDSEQQASKATESTAW